VFLRAGPKTHGEGEHDHPRFLEEWRKLLGGRGCRVQGALRFPTAAELEQSDVLERAAPEAAGVMVANPPYGERIGSADELAAFYPKLGDALKKKFAGWSCFFFTADMRLPKLIRLQPARRTPLWNGSLECRLYEFRIVSGSNRG